MKPYLSLLFLFNLIFCNAQQFSDKQAFKKCKKEFKKKTCLSDEDGDGILYYLDQCPNDAGPIENDGCPKKDCSKNYELEKMVYEKRSKELENTDFNKLFDIIFDEPEFLKNFSNGKKIIFMMQLLIGNNEPDISNNMYYDCPRYKGNLNDIIFKNVWNKTNFLKFKKKIGEKIIIPVAGFNQKDFIFGNQEKDLNYFSFYKINPFYEGAIVENGKNMKFYYYSSTKPSKNLKIEREKNQTSQTPYIVFSIVVTPIYTDNSLNYFNIQLKFNNEKNEFEVTKPKYYQYKEEKWILLKKDK